MIASNRLLMSRTYDMSLRARRAAETRNSITDAAEALLATGAITDATLQAIAAGAGVSVQTVVRHFGSRNGILEAVWGRVEERVLAGRGAIPAGDVDAALTALLEHYESEGRLILNLLSQETIDPDAQEVVRFGRDYHRGWVERCFGPLLSSGTTEEIDALVAATDLYVWKLLRLDMGRSPSAARAVMSRLVHAAIGSS